jgi:hypothetical protein
VPFLRFNRDKRGYENTVVVHSDRRKGRSTRILYLFRTPPGVKVGRAALDEEAIRLIEAHNPDVEFDWPRILEGERRPPVKPAPPIPPPRAKKERPAEPEPPLQMEQPESEPPEPVSEPTAAGARLGAEGLARLRARYSEILARISGRVEDTDRQAELKTLAERLNPDGWVTDGDVLAGLDGYEVTFESLRTAIGPRRRPGKPAPQGE